LVLVGEKNRGLEMQPGTMIYGTFFGGGWEGADIYFAQGSLSGSTLTITGVDRCEDDLDLCGAMRFLRGPWGLDFPFALPAEIYHRGVPLRDWRALLDLADSWEGPEFEANLYTLGIVDSQNFCQHPDDGCRITDVESGAFSPLKRWHPNRLEMTHRGLKLLGSLERYGVSVYPFDEPDRTRPRLYEVNPANTLARIGVENTNSPWDFIEAFNKREGRAVQIAPLPATLPREYALDAVVSCATLANAIVAFDLDYRWNEKPACATALEWEVRHKEGLIVRL
jgi:hypothetical protein